MNERSTRKALVTMGAILWSALAWSGVARANQYGQLAITQNTTLTDDRYGAVIFAADNIILDCNFHQVHISSHTRLNCAPQLDDQKCGIVAVGRTGITIRNCVVMGGFDYGVNVQASRAVQITNTVVAGSGWGFNFSGNTNVFSDQISAYQTGIGVYINEDTNSFFQNTHVSAYGTGISIGSSRGTTLRTATVRDTFDWGVFSGANQDLTLDMLSVEDCLDGVYDVDSSRTVIANSVFRANRRSGVALLDNTSSNVLNNEITGNNINGAACGDAWEINGIGNSWSGNQIATWCGDVPANH